MIIDPFTGIAHWEETEQPTSHIAYINAEGVLIDTRTRGPEAIQPFNIKLNDEGDK